MANYLLVEEATNRIVNSVVYDGTQGEYPPVGYVLKEPYEGAEIDTEYSPPS